MLFTERLRNLAPQRKADKETVDALQALNQWADTQKHQATETVNLLNRALVQGDKAAVTRAYGAMARLMASANGKAELVGTIELLQDKLFERLDVKPRER